MEIKGKVYCFFEQSGTFKNEFRKLGIPAEDYDIQNQFGETDHIIDLFKEIENAYDGKESIFDEITKDDFIIAFYPCIYFCQNSGMLFYWHDINYRNLSLREKTEKILKRAKDREYFYETLIKFCFVCQERGLRMVFENPYTTPHYLVPQNFVKEPTFIDHNRQLMGDYFRKPTMYYFFNCEPTNDKIIQVSKDKKAIYTTKGEKTGGICGTERSLIHPDYARNFICSKLLGKKTERTIPTLF